MEGIICGRHNIIIRRSSQWNKLGFGIGIVGVRCRVNYFGGNREVFVVSARLVYSFVP